MEQSGDTLTKIANNTITIILARAMAVFGPIAAAWVFTSTLGTIDASIKGIQLDMRALWADVNDIKRSSAVQSVELITHDKKIDLLGSRITYIERGSKQ